MSGENTTDAKATTLDHKDQYFDTPALQREAFVFGGAFKDSLARVVEEPVATVKLAGIGVATGLAYTALASKAAPLAVAMDVAGTFAFVKLGPAVMASFNQGKQIWDRTWTGKTDLVAERHAAKEITNDVVDFGVATAGGMIGPAARALQFNRQWKALDLGDVGFVGKRPAAPLDPELAAAFRRAKPAIGRVITADNKQTIGGMGSAAGFFVDSDGAFLTCLNALDGAQKVNVVLPDRGRYAAELLGTDKKLDLALLRLTKKSIDEKFPFLPFSSISPSVDKEVIAGGFSQDLSTDKFILSTGKFDAAGTMAPSGTEGLFMKSQPGLNGSPVLDQAGRVRSMLQYSIALNKGGAGLNLLQKGGGYSAGAKELDMLVFIMSHRNGAGTPLKELI